MNDKLIVHAMNSNVRSGGRKDKNYQCWAELMLLYEDGTWEKIFEYRWDCSLDAKRVNTGRLTNITRSEAIAKLEKDYYSGKLQGIFMD